MRKTNRLLIGKSIRLKNLKTRNSLFKESIYKIIKLAFHKEISKIEQNDKKYYKDYIIILEIL